MGQESALSFGLENVMFEKSVKRCYVMLSGVKQNQRSSELLFIPLISSYFNPGDTRRVQ